MAAPTVVASGPAPTNPAIIGTEHILYETTTGENYTGSVNKINMTAGDTVEIRFFKKVLAGSSQDLVEKRTFSDAPTEDTGTVYYLPHVSCPFGMKLTLKQTAGTGRNYDWSVERP
jgi:hypothetical protein